ncbi:MAG: prolyl oligopeptidase family serine peptidase [Paucibacter sp.]|nr:prolyl oligopeptidase family serine peptidase [Roseateles sp.]
MLPHYIVIYAVGRLRLACFFHLVFMLALFAAWPIPSAGAAVGPTVKEVIEFTRIIQPVKHDDETLQTQISPDGELAFIVTRKADVATDTNRFEILLMDISPERLAASKPPAPMRQLAVEARDDNDDADPALRDARWVSNRTIVFRARMNDEAFQAYKVDVLTRQVTQLTHAPLGLVTFDVSSDLRHVVYVAPVQNPAIPSGARSVVAGTNSFWSIHGRRDSLRTQQRRYQFYVSDAGSRTPARPLGEAFAESSHGFPSVSISPDGRWLLLPKYEPGRQLVWGKLYPQIAEATQQYGPSLAQDPLGYYSRPTSYVARRMVAYRLADGQERAVVDAPDDSLGGNQLRKDRLWQDGGTSVVIAGTYLPRREGDADTPSASASHIIEYWPESGTWKPIAELKQRLKDTHLVGGMSGAFVAVDGEQRRRFELSADGGWHEVAGEHAEAKIREASQTSWRLRVDQALNQPPDIVAVGPGGATVRLTELNPQFSAGRWGTMREFGWTDAQGRSWNGGLMVPADFDPRAKHALVIQPYGFSATRFYRDGSNIYDGFTSGFAGRAFLRESILVLALPWRATTGAPTDEYGSRIAFADGVRAAIEALVAEGFVDRARVGILGWSATGMRVLNLVTFTDTPIRAATLLDGDSNTLYSMTITYAVKDGTQVMKERANQGGPYGESRQRWIRNDPSLHTDCIRAALRIETYGHEAKNNWDIYALLRRQYRPAELITIPEGAHALSRPSERMISLQGNVDWYRFWLKGEQRSEIVLATETVSSLKEQYERWEQMATLKQAADAKPACD